MAVLESLSPAVEPYSIDEMFIDLRGVNRCISPEVFGHQLREQVKSWTGLTMGVGIAPTKTLAKSAQWATKQWPQFSGVVALTAENRNRILKLLGLQPVGEVWGVGRRLTEKLNALGINTALQLAQANTAFIRKNFSVILERTVRELNGESCISLEEAHRQNSRLSVVAVLVNESQTKMPCTRLLFSMQSGPQRNYVGSVSIAGR
ncbi:impB/mucB/samB family protein [Escherichia coli P0302293.3]|nr:impB/mucB/samB family protein [Escherichia coli P0302293.3]ENE30045.1 impB/mucB/samB family protein [Escherichia coli P0302293.6]